MNKETEKLFKQYELLTAGSDKRIAEAIALLKSHERGRRVIELLSQILDDGSPASGLDRANSLAATTLVSEFFITKRRFGHLLKVEVDKKNLINDWEPETASLLAILIKHGFNLLTSVNGEDEPVTYNDEQQKKFLEHLTSCDDSHLYVEKDGVKLWLYLVFGNDPGELVSDYSFTDELQKSIDAAVLEHRDEWEGKQQPKKERKQ